MNLIIVLFSFLNLPFSKDTMQFPIHGGRIYSPDSAFQMERPNGIYITVPKTSYVHSTSDGTVGISMLMDSASGFVVSVNSGEKIYGYTMLDTVYVRKNQIIHRGEVLGVKYKTTKNITLIGFSVITMKKTLNAKKYIILSK